MMGMAASSYVTISKINQICEIEGGVIDDEQTHTNKQKRKRDWDVYIFAFACI